MDDDELKLAQINDEKRRLELDRMEAHEAQKMATQMAQKNKAKKEEREIEEARAAAKAKIEQKTAAIDAKMKAAEKEALKQAKKDEKIRKKNAEKDDMIKQHLENEVSNMDKMLEDIESGAKATKERLEKKKYDDDDDDDELDINDLQLQTDMKIGHEIDEVEMFDASVQLNFDDTDHDEDEFEKIRREIEENLAASKEQNANKTFEFEDSHSTFNYIDSIKHARAPVVRTSLSSVKENTYNPFDYSMQLDFSETDAIMEEGVDDARERRLNIIQSSAKAQQELNDKKFDESFVIEADDFSRLYARAEVSTEKVKPRTSNTSMFDDSVQLDFSELENIEEENDDAEEQRLNIETSLGKATEESNDKKFNESIVEADDLGRFHARAGNNSEEFNFEELSNNSEEFNSEELSTKEIEETKSKKAETTDDVDEMPKKDKKKKKEKKEKKVKKKKKEK